MKLNQLIHTANAHESMTIGMLLSLLGGFLDAYTYTLEGGVFANAQTGNLVLLSVSIVSGETDKIIKYLVPILMFAIGIFLSEFIKSFNNISHINRVKFVILFESIMILFIGFFGSSLSGFVVNSTISFLAAIQVANFNRIYDSPVATTMITGNLRSTMGQLCLLIKTKDKKHAINTLVYFLIILFFAIGASAGAYSSHHLGHHAIFLCLIFLSLSYGIIGVNQKKTTGANLKNPDLNGVLNRKKLL